jgi:DNA-binding transcriptional ArsR family regulator
VNATRDLSSIGRLLASDARSTMLDTLMDGDEHSVTELAGHARVAPSTASAHLAALTGAGLVEVRAEGRHRRVRLKGPEVARALEGLAAISTPAGVSSLRGSTARGQLAYARTCYDHLAGRVGIAMADGLVRRGAVVHREGTFALSDVATGVLSPMGIDLGEVQGARRPVVLACLDWTEGRPHVAGALGASLCSLLMRSGAIRRRRGTRAVVLTDAGAAFLQEHLGVRLA